MRSCRYAIVLGTLPLLLAYSLVLREVVLCVGQDGHTTIEAAVGGQCAESAKVVPWSRIAMASVADHCGPCVDVPMVVAGAQLSTLNRDNPLHARTLHLASAHLPANTRITIAYAAVRPSLSHGLPPDTHPSRALSTIVLLT